MNALVHLFAIVAAVNEKDVSRSGIEILENFLARYLPEILIRKYLSLYNDYLDFYKNEFSGSDTSSENTAKNPLLSFQVSNVCHQIRHDLLRRERLIVLVQLIRFVNEDNIISEYEDAFLHYVAEAFHIETPDFHNIRGFLLSDNSLVSEGNIAIVGDVQNQGLFIHRALPAGEQIDILKISGIRNFLIRFHGVSELQINSKVVMPGEFYFLREGDIIKGAFIQPVYYSDVFTTFYPKISQSITFSADHISIRYRNSNQGIQPFSFSETGGQLIGIMGGSGTGKSTLLRILAGKQKPDSGTIFFNGHDLYKNRIKFKGLIGYVPQDDLLIEELSVFENLYINGKLSLGNYSSEEIKLRIEKILADLDLDEIRDLKVGDVLNKVISGGQRKRLNIALELIREPSLLFVDEPTSGLSSTDSENIVDLLKRQAIHGKLVISTIHQPSSQLYRLFDKIWILDKYGYPVYTGNPIEAIEYFKKISAQVDAVGSECPVCGSLNPDQILEIIEAKKVSEDGKATKERKITPEKWYAFYCNNLQNQVRPERKVKKLPLSDFRIPGDLVQFNVFFRRNLLRKLHNKQYWFINLLEAPILAVILGFFSKYVSENGYVFSDNRNIPVFLFMSVIVALFMGLTISAEEIFRDRKILERESYLFLSRPIYLNSKILLLFLVSAIQTFSFVLIGNYILEIKGMTFFFWLILFSTSCFGNLLGLNISSALDSVIAIYISIPLILVPEILLGGAMIPFDDLNKNLTSQKYVPIIGDLMTTRWAYEALAVVQFQNNKYEKEIFPYEKAESNANYHNSFLIPEMQIRLGLLRQNIDDPKNTGNVVGDLQLIRNALSRLVKYQGSPPFELYQKLYADSINQEILDELEGYLYFLQQTFSDIANQALNQKDKILDSLDMFVDEPLFKLKQTHFNDKMASLVLNRNNIRKIVLWKNQWIQKMDPIFMNPENNFGRSQMFSSQKMINYTLVDTFLFNLITIWSMTIFLYFTLVFNIFRKIISFLGLQD